MMHVDGAEVTNYILTANGYDVAPIARVSKVRSRVQMMQKSQKHKCKTVVAVDIGIHLV